VVSGNTAEDGGGTYLGNLSNCIVWGNLAGGVTNNHLYSTFTYSCTMPLPSGIYNKGGNITQDPLFVGAANGDFRLRPGSPCINKGSNAYAAGEFDLDGNPRIYDGVVDMGAYEFGSTPPQMYTTGTPVHVPFSWLDQWGGNSGNYEALAKSKGLNGYFFWESFVAGLNPTDAGSKFAITNFAVNAQSRVSKLDWSPRRSDRVYTVWGKTNLTDTTPWYTPTNDATRFFKVEVKLP